MEIRQFEPEQLEAAKALLKEVFWREGSSPRFNEWEFAARLLDDEGYIPSLCLTAWEGERCIGYSALTAAEIGGQKGLGLGPLGVGRAWQGRGVGAALVREGVERARRQKHPWIVLLGGDYYARFGFEPGAGYGVTVSEDEFENQHLQILFLGDGPRPSGKLTYCSSFYDQEGNLL